MKRLPMSAHSSTPDRNTLIRDLGAIVGETYVLHDLQDMQPFVREWH